MLIITINNRPLTGPMAIEKFVTKYSIFTFFSYTHTHTHTHTQKKLKGKIKERSCIFMLLDLDE